MKKIIFLLIFIVGVGIFLMPKVSLASSCGGNYAFSSTNCGGSFYRDYSNGYAFGNSDRYDMRDDRNTYRYNYGNNYDYGFGGYRNSGYNNYAFESGYRYNNYYFGRNYAF